MIVTRVADIFCLSIFRQDGLLQMGTNKRALEGS